MPPNCRDNILAAIRKKGAFTYNRFSTNQARDYRKPLEELEAESVIACLRASPNRWIYSQGAKWNRRA